MSKSQLVSVIAASSKSSQKSSKRMALLQKSNFIARTKNKMEQEQIRDGAQEENIYEHSVKIPERPDFVASAKDKISSNLLQVKLEVLLLNYIFNEDDGMISFKEKRAIKKHYSSYKNRILKSDISYLKDISGIGNDFNDITKFIVNNKLSKSELLSAISTLKVICKNSSRYSSSISYIEGSLYDL